ncbi:MAG: hypothetical protein JWO69_692 [Thermoleophilia bacterium]|jgi:hypothetical protein|nr:hypothetical protein [Thermoleophilia bacterium]
MAVTDRPQVHDGVVDHHPEREESMGVLLKQLAHDTSTLVRQEFELAKAETAEKAHKAGPGIGMFGGAGLLAMLAAGTLTATFVAAIAEATPVWLAALIVTVVYAAIAGVLALVGRDKVKEALPPKPEQTIESLKEDVAWARTQMQSARK